MKTIKYQKIIIASAISIIVLSLGLGLGFGLRKSNPPASPISPASPTIDEANARANALTFARANSVFSYNEVSYTVTNITIFDLAKQSANLYEIDLTGDETPQVVNGVPLLILDVSRDNITVLDSWATGFSNFTEIDAKARAAQYANNASSNKTFLVDDITYTATNIMVTSTVANDTSYDITLQGTASPRLITGTAQLVLNVTSTATPTITTAWTSTAGSNLGKVTGQPYLYVNNINLMYPAIFIGNNVFSTTATISGSNNDENVFYANIRTSSNNTLFEKYNVVYPTATALSFVATSSNLTGDTGFTNITATGFSVTFTSTETAFLFLAYLPATPNFLYFVINSDPDGQNGSLVVNVNSFCFYSSSATPNTNNGNYTLTFS